MWRRRIARGCRPDETGVTQRSSAADGGPYRLRPAAACPPGRFLLHCRTVPADPLTELSAIDAAILAGGLGTRVAGVLGDLPKVLAPVGDRVFLDHLLDRLAAQGIRRVVLCLGHGAAAVEAHLRRHPRGDLEISCSVEAEPLGTAGAIAHARALLTSDPVLVLNGDTLIELDLAAFLRAYRAGGGGIAIVCALMPGDRYGRVEIDAAGRVARFREKAQGDGAPGWTSAGVYLLDRATLAAIAALGRGSLERDLLERCPPGSIHAFRATGGFIDIGTPQTVAAARRGLDGLAGRRDRR